MQIRNYFFYKVPINLFWIGKNKQIPIGFKCWNLFIRNFSYYKTTDEKESESWSHPYQLFSSFLHLNYRTFFVAIVIKRFFNNYMTYTFHISLDIVKFLRIGITQIYESYIMDILWALRWAYWNIAWVNRYGNKMSNKLR